MEERTELLEERPGPGSVFPTPPHHLVTSGWEYELNRNYYVIYN